MITESNCKYLQFYKVSNAFKIFAQFHIKWILLYVLMIDAADRQFATNLNNLRLTEHQGPPFETFFYNSEPNF
jgi:hypothetical protein